MRLFIVRHGQTEWNLLGRAQGHTDIPLDSTGMRQTEMVAARFAHEGRLQIYTSDLQRAALTAQAISDRSGANVIRDARLRERSFGDMEGKTFAEIFSLLDKGKSIVDYDQNGGEPYSAVWDRVAPLVQNILRLRQDAMVVTHGGTAGIVLAQVMKGTLDTARGFRFGNTAVTEVQRRNDGSFLLVRYNCMEHLTAPAKLGDAHGSVR